MPKDWNDYQEEAAEFFRALGLEASTNVTVEGVRTKHDIDVLVRSRHVGFEVTWIVECKHWSSRVSKLHVLALREIVADIGADRGILLAEGGFQSGAAEAAALTNVHLISLSDARKTTSAEVFSMRLRDLYDRMDLCKERYWSISKMKRIEFGLRPDTPGHGYSGAMVISLIGDLLRKAFRGNYPIESDPMLRHATEDFPEAIDSVESLVAHIEPLISDLEHKLDTCLNAPGQST